MSTDDKIILKIKDIAKSAIPSGSKAILYGSRARGDARNDSDWDILILLDKDKLEQTDYDKVSYPFVLCGATTNTPALGAAQQTLKQMGEPASGAALSCAVTYPLGVVGVILAMLLVRKLFVRPSDIDIHEHEDTNQTFIATFKVHNPAIFNKSIKEVALLSYPKFVISRLWREGTVSIPTSEKILKENDRLLVITTEKDAPSLTILFGEQENQDWNKEDIDWNAIDSQLISKHIVISRPEINGKKLGSLRLRNSYGINISRVMRSGVQLLATPGLILQLGDRLTVVGEAKAIENVEKVLGNAVKTLKDPNPCSGGYFCHRL